VSARTAIEDSLNVPTARLALQVGLKRIVQMARALGITSPLQAVPALSLGAFEVSPIELATVYATFANGGIRPSIHGVDAVIGPGGEPVAGSALPEPTQALAPSTVYLMTSVLQGVLNHGTATAVRNTLSDPLAGKTGTTNGRRDSWFAGFAPTRTTLVWVGYDDNSETRLSGARAALPIWSKFMLAVRPPGGYGNFASPSGTTTATVDPETGELATDRCPKVMTEVFLLGTCRPSSAICIPACSVRRSTLPRSSRRDRSSLRPRISGGAASRPGSRRSSATSRRTNARRTARRLNAAIGERSADSAAAFPVELLERIAAQPQQRGAQLLPQSGFEAR
jgi:membrane peptidoglycan carboxypeptidase